MERSEAGAVDATVESGASAEAGSGSGGTVDATVDSGAFAEAPSAAPDSSLGSSAQVDPDASASNPSSPGSNDGSSDSLDASTQTTDASAPSMDASAADSGQSVEDAATTPADASQQTPDTSSQCSTPCCNDPQVGKLGMSCSNGLKGACAKTGSFVCQASSVRCDAPTPAPTTETCDGVDNDCDGAVDESDAIDATNWYPDCDNDGYAANNATATRRCSKPAAVAPCTAWTSRAPTSVATRDCNDTSAIHHPGAGFDMPFDPAMTMPAPDSSAYDLNCDGTAELETNGQYVIWDVSGPKATVQFCPGPPNGCCITQASAVISGCGYAMSADIECGGFRAADWAAYYRCR